MRPSLVLDPDSVGAEGQSRQLVAEAGHLDALAEAFGVEGVKSCKADLQVQARGPILRVSGKAAVTVNQICVVTLDDLERFYECDIERTFDRRLPEWPDAEEVDLAEEPDDAPEPLEGGVFDLWAIALDELALAIDPFPRRDGAELPDQATVEEPVEDRKPNPFAVLADWKPKKKDDTDAD